MRVHTWSAVFLLLPVAAPGWLLSQTDDATPALVQPSSPQPTFVSMTQRERLYKFLKGIVSPLAFVSSGASAGIGQWRGTPKEWREGGAGYGQRFASSFAQHVARRTITYGLASGLHEDNRYIRSGQAGFGARFRYVVASTFRARRDDGSQHISYSRLGGLAGSSLVSRLWQPPSNRHLKGAGVSFGISLGVAVGFNFAREFLPDLRHGW